MVLKGYTGIGSVYAILGNLAFKTLNGTPIRVSIEWKLKTT